jgi:DNA-binding LacI/PurR family transcriptional regulator
VFNDRCALGVLDVLQRAGLAVPGDISVVGYDDSHLARMSHVNLTTIAQDTEQITTLAVTRAIDRLDGTPVTEREQVIPPHLFISAKTASVHVSRILMKLDVTTRGEAAATAHRLRLVSAER